MLAIDYLKRELGARLTPRPGKAFQPAQPSKNQYSPAQLAAVEAVLGAASPLQVKRLPPAAGRSSYSITLPGGQYQDGKEELAWAQGSLVARSLPDGSVTVRGQMPSLRVADSTGTTSMTGLRFTGSQQRDYWSGQSDVAVDKIDLAPTGTQGAAGSFEQFRHSLQVARDGSAYGARLDITVGRLLLGGHGVDQLRLAARLRNLDAATLGQLQKEELAQQASGQGSLDSLDVLTRHLPAIKRLAMRGAVLELDQFSFRYKGHELSLKGSVRMPDAGEADFASAGAVLAKLHGKLEVAMPLALLRQAADDIALSASQDADKRALPPAEMGARIYEQQVGSLLTKRYAWREQDMLHTTLELQAGVLTANGHAVPLDVLLAVFRDKAPGSLPPADTSEPQLLGMRDRGLEVAQVFALNGDTQGMFDLCDRYLEGIGVPANVAEGTAWCEKAMAKGSDKAVYTLARRQLDGNYRGDFAPVLAKLAAFADSAEDPEAQFLMSRFATDNAKAADYLRRAAAGGYADALAQAGGAANANASAGAPQPAASPWRLTLAAQGAYYGAGTYRFDSRLHRKLRLSIDELAKHEQWSSITSLCLMATMPSDAACLRLQGMQDGSVAVFAELVAKGGSSKQGRKELARRIQPGQALDLVLYSDGYQAYFLIDGEPPLALDIGFPAETLHFVCSGARCALEFRRAPE
ncbi:DUF945 family protein [Pseudoduganella sp.]|uniref:DUF945 family protein n=1 Tax=Pseudoduganella sp. TaxID=1880898 RepID=UPI0035B04469